MKVIESDKVVFFDVDDTFIHWGSGKDTNFKGRLFYIERGNAGTYYFKSIDANIEAMRVHKSRGHTIVVWSAGGWEWARDVVRMLELENIVDVVMSKPAWVYDDLPAAEYMPNSKFAKDEHYVTNEIYKNQSEQRIPPRLEKSKIIKAVPLPGEVIPIKSNEE